MPFKTLPDRDLVRRLLRYDDATGELIWLPRPRAMFSSANALNTWNTRYSGKAAGYVRRSGHLAVAVGHTQYRAHRLVWLYVYGAPVPELIDHADGDKLNNRISNLRAATKAENGANMRARAANRTGVKGTGVFRNGRFRARVMLHGKDYHLGYFATLEEAAKARREAAERLHGEFVRHE
jgi:hypothetical protein